MANHTPCGIELPQVFFDGPTDMEHIRKFATRAETLGYRQPLAAGAGHRRFHHAGTGDPAQLRGGDHDEIKIGNFGHPPAAAKSVAVGESLLDLGRHERRSCGHGRRARWRSSWVA